MILTALLWCNPYYLWENMLFLGFLVTVVCLLPVNSSGYFEIQVNTLQNPRGEVMDGSCCDGQKDSSNTCTSQCSTKIRVCLREYQSIVNFDGKCTFGSISSDVLGGNSFTFAEGSGTGRLQLHFDFGWTVGSGIDCIVWTLFANT